MQEKERQMDRLRDKDRGIGMASVEVSHYPVEAGYVVIWPQMAESL